jgi:hypothetical protein
MRRSAAILFFVATLLLVPAAPGHAQGHGGGSHSYGSHSYGSHGYGWHGYGSHGYGSHGYGWHGYGWHGYGWYGGVYIGAPWLYPYWYPYSYPYPYPSWYYPAPYSAYPMTGFEGQSSVYIQQEPAPSAAPPQGYWYYCASAKAYYPKVKKCREAWIKVPPPPE